MTSSKSGDRRQLIKDLNDDLAREYQAIIAYVVYSQTLKGAAFMTIAKELEVHAGEELAHAITIAKHIDYLGGTPVVTPLPVRQTDDAKRMLQADLENENATIRAYRQRVVQCEKLGELRHCRGYPGDPSPGAGASERPGHGARYRCPGPVIQVARGCIRETQPGVNRGDETLRPLLPPSLESPDTVQERAA